MGWILSNYFINEIKALQDKNKFKLIDVRPKAIYDIVYLK
jgi:hypothetical protein